MSRQPIQLKKRGSIWHYSFTSPSGERIRQSAKTSSKTQAQELAASVYNEYWRVLKLGDRPDYTWPEAVVQWMNEKPERKQSDNVRYILQWLDKYLGDKKLIEINRELIVKIQKAKAAEGVKNRTINAVLQQMRGVLKSAVEWEWIDKCPVIKLLDDSKRRIKWLTEQEEANLLAELPEHLQPITQFAILTGLRMSNITRLEWSQVDFDNNMAIIHADQSKTRQAIGVPLNGDAMALLQAQKGKHKQFVFSYKGKPILRANQRAWRNAVARAGLGDFHFHDLRHTWATRHIMSGTQLYVLQELGGWSSSETVRKYAHLSVAYLHQQANNVSKTDTKLAQNQLH